MSERKNDNIWMMGWVSFFTDLASAMIKPIIPVYVVLVLHEGVDKLGVVVAVSTFISFSLRWLGGWVSDYFGRSKPFLILGYGLSAITKPLIGFTSSWQGVAVLSASERMGKAVRAASKDKLISLSSNSKKQGRAFGLHKTLDISGEALGALVAFIILYYFGKNEYWVREIFYWTALPSALSILVLIFFVKDQKEIGTHRVAKPGVKVPIEAFTKLLKLELVIYFIASFLMVSESFMLIRAHEAGVMVAFLPLLLMAGTLTQAFISYFTGKSADEHGDEIVLIWGISAGLISLLFLALGENNSVALGFIFQGVFMVSTINAIRMRLGKFKQAKGKIYGWFYSVHAVVTASGALLTGYLWQVLGGTDTLIVFVISYSFIFLVYLVARPYCRQSVKK